MCPPAHPTTPLGISPRWRQAGSARRGCPWAQRHWHCGGAGSQVLEVPPPQEGEACFRPFYKVTEGEAPVPTSSGTVPSGSRSPAPGIRAPMPARAPRQIAAQAPTMDHPEVGRTPGGSWCRASPDPNLVGDLVGRATRDPWSGAACMGAGSHLLRPRLSGSEVLLAHSMG